MTSEKGKQETLCGEVEDDVLEEAMSQFLSKREAGFCLAKKTS